MQARRRFELHKGNKELFWEIWRLDGIITTRYGKIGREEAAEEKERDFGEYRTAEVEFDRLIRQRMTKGYTEVYKASTPKKPLEYREVRMVTLEGNHGIDLDLDEFEKVINWMIDPIEVVDKSIKSPDLARWQHRALRLLRMTEIPEDDENYDAFISKLREITKEDRSRSRLKNAVPSFKFLDPQFWIVNAEEAQWIAGECGRTLNKRVRSRLDKGKELTAKQILFQKWVAFNEKAVKLGGYEVRSTSAKFTAPKFKTSLGFDAMSYNQLINLLVEMDVVDDQDESPEKIAEAIFNEIPSALKKLNNSDAPPLPHDYEYSKFLRYWHAKTKKYRSAVGKKGKIPFYKFVEPFRWLLSVDECQLIADKSLAYQEGNEDLQLKPILDDMISFFTEAVNTNGCEIVLIESEIQMAYDNAEQ